MLQDPDLKRLREIAYNTTCSNTELGVFLSGIADRLEDAVKAANENAALRQELATKDEEADALRQHHHVAEQAIEDFGKAQVEIEKLRKERDALGRNSP